jgi:phage baseplate assembly protein W
MYRSDYNIDEQQPLLVAPSQLYADLPLSFIPHPNSKDIRPLTDINAVKQAVKNLVLSNFVDRPFHPELGGNITRLLFEPANKFTAAVLRDEVIRLLQKREPRVRDIKCEVQLDEEYNRLLVTITFTVKTTQQNTEVSFYLDRIR